jgi:catechol 2,3-dioxygenase-like lactoylglutathione lyase family enzyme
MRRAYTRRIANPVIPVSTTTTTIERTANRLIRAVLALAMSCAANRPADDRPTVSPLLVVGDLARSLAFYERVVGATRVIAGESYAKLALGRGELHLVTRSEPTPDKPGVTLGPPDPDAATVHGEVVLHVRDCRAIYARMVASGARFLAPPTVPPWGHEVRAFLRDPDGHLIELSQTDE